MVISPSRLVVHGSLSIVVGVVALAVAFVRRPDLGAVIIATVFGLFSFGTGVVELTTASAMRAIRQESDAPLTVG